MKGKRIYIAASYSRRSEMFDYALILERYGFEITSHWIDGRYDGVFGAAQETVGQPETTARSRAILQAQQAAWLDLQGVQAADILLSFTGQPRSAPLTGGRHVELGYALGLGKRIIRVGPRENLFHWIDTIEFFDSWEEALDQLAVEAGLPRRRREPTPTISSTLGKII